MQLPLASELRLAVLTDPERAWWRESELGLHAAAVDVQRTEQRNRALRRLGQEHGRLPVEQLEKLWSQRLGDLSDEDTTARAETALGLVGEALAYLARRYVRVRGGLPVARWESLLEHQEVRLRVHAEQIACWAVAEEMVRTGRRSIDRQHLDWRLAHDVEDLSLARVLERPMVDNHVHLGGVLGTADMWREVLDPRLKAARREKLLQFRRIWSTDLLAWPVPQRMDDLRTLRDLLTLQLRELGLIKGPRQHHALREGRDRLLDAVELELRVTRGRAVSQALLHVLRSGRTDQVLPLASSPWWREVLPRREPVAVSVVLLERELLVHAFAACIGVGTQAPPAWFKAALNMYLVLQNIFHRVVTQYSERVGLGNFLEWYDAPGRDLRRFDHFSRHQLTLRRATRDFHVRLEGRCTPRPSAIRAWIAAFEAASKGCSVELGRHFGLVVHFIKQADPLRARYEGGPGRVPTEQLVFGALRTALRLEAMELERVRAQDPKVSTAVVGIDAARSETDTPPEVFAPVFRFLRRTLPGTFSNDSDLGRRLPASLALRATFHAGESFHHPLVGLKAVDEAIHFLDLQHGDRIGHGMVLGVDPARWLDGAGGEAGLTRGERLDVLVWAVRRLRACPGADGQLAANIDEVIGREARYLYGPSLGVGMLAGRALLGREATEILGWAWRLRWMDPEVLFDVLDRMGWRRGWLDTTDHAPGGLVVGRSQRSLLCAAGPGAPTSGRTVKEVSAAEVQMKLHRFHAGLARQWRMTVADAAPILSGEVPPAAVRCLWIHHYDRRHDQLAQEMVAWDGALPHAATLFERLREMVLDELRRRRIALEICPTSNERVGAFGALSQHPVFSLDSRGLKGGSEGALRRDPVRVVVCSDDPGIFCTSTVQEYVLLARAAEDRGEHPDDILAWLEHLRLRSLGLTFLRAEGAGPVEEAPRSTDRPVRLRKDVGL